MDHQHLSKRLAKVAEYVPNNARLADIGSDHAYLPAFLEQQGKLNFGIAGEVVKGPYESAKSLVASLNLTDTISVRLGDGLDVVRQEDELNTITICGMGGSLIRDILQRGKEANRLTGDERLILQPNVGEYVLRVWLIANDYHILDEHILMENRKIYEIIVAEKKDMPQTLSEKELIFGPVLLKNKHNVFYNKWQQEIEKNDYVMAQLGQSQTDKRDKIEAYRQKSELIKEVISCQ